MFRRPKRGEDEDDLFDFQQRFISSEAKSSAKVIKVNTKPAEKDIVQLKDDGSNRTQKVRFSFPSDDGVKAKKAYCGNAEDPEEALDNYDYHITAVLSRIIERDVSHSPVTSPRSSDRAFPEVLSRTNVLTSLDSGTKEKKRSLFSQHFSKGKEDFGVNAGGDNKSEFYEAMQIDELAHKPTTKVTAFGAKSRMIDGSGLGDILGRTEVEKIHMENTSFLSTMSEEQILQEQDKMMSTLDSKLVAFIKAKKDRTHSSVMTRKRPAESPSGGENREVKMQAPASITNQERTLRNDETPQSKILEAALFGNQMEIDQLQEQEIELAKRRDKETMEIDSSELPIQPNTQWLHMSKVESDKLAWIKDLPKAKPIDTKTGYPARFDFHGYILKQNAEIDVKEGLHHHGDQPEAPGYTIEELFKIIRSTYPSQRVLALQTLGNISRLANEGVYEDYLDIPLIPQLLEAGVIFILRYALDDNTETVLAAAVQAMQALLVCQSDEMAMDRVFIWHRGHEAFLFGSEVPPIVTDPNEEKKDLSDLELVKQDVIKGLIQMKLIPRLRYFLEVCHPDINSVVAALNILIRVARHSLQSASEVLNCPRLMITIFDNFLPLLWEPHDTDSPMTIAYGFPLHQAVKLMRIIATAGKHSALDLMANYHLMKHLLRYITSEPSELMLNLKEACLLSIESLRTWKVLASYGLACDEFLDIYPILMQQIVYCQNLSMRGNPGNFKCERAATLISLLTALVSVASCHDEIYNKMIRAEEDTDCLTPPPIQWSNIIGLLEPIETCLNKWSWEFFQENFTEDSAVNLLASAMNFISNFYSKHKIQVSCNIVDLLENMEALCSRTILPLIKSSKFQTCLVNLRSFSILASEMPKLSNRSAPNLPTIHSLLNRQRVCPLIDEHTPVGIVTALLRLLLDFSNIHRGLDQQLYNLILLTPVMKSYLSSVCQMAAVAGPRSKICFTRFENYLLYLLIKLANLKIKTSTNFSLFHKMSLVLVSEFLPGDEHLLFDLMSSIIFSSGFLLGCERTDEVIAAELSKLQLNDRNSVPQVLQVNAIQLLQEIHKDLASIRGMYLKYLSHLHEDVNHSRNRDFQVAHEVQKLTLGRCGSTLLNKEWMYLPLVKLFHRVSQWDETSQKTVDLPADANAIVIKCLQCVYLLELWYRDFMSYITPNVKYVRIASIYLMGSTIFLETSVQLYLQALFSELCHPDIQDKIDLKSKIPGIASFYDLYKLLLDQYEAESFGNSVFGYFILLPQQQRHSVEFRKLLWNEHSAGLRSLNIPINQSVLSVNRYLEPLESNVDLLKLYGMFLLSGVKLWECSPFLYVVVIHHLHYFLFRPNNTHKFLRASLIKTLQQDKHKILADHLFLYKAINPQCEFGLDLYSEIPQVQSNMLTQLCQ